MKQLILMRHAEAQPDHMIKVDRDRTLSGQGLKQLDEICQKLQGKLHGVDLVLCSNARRTRQTLDGIKKLLPSSAEVIFEDKLYQASTNYILERVKRIDDGYKNVLVICHNPALQQFLNQSHQMNSSQFALRPFETCSLAFFELDGEYWMGADFGSLRITNQIAAQ